MHHLIQIGQNEYFESGSRKLGQKIENSRRLSNGSGIKRFRFLIALLHVVPSASIGCYISAGAWPANN